ncbi:DUF1801 domain-containing protein [Fulvivirgaceae bacterium BMA10]|uniref:DUF1801 domain-containing protein n=1 Tax=Splendidivirga corallicola TaxID=3051826 RepID=A0ABT8KHM4_9BACT|nr:DUF1801 domain-containing protein [Fulvivirgaceae bacterium BMA10]
MNIPNMLREIDNFYEQKEEPVKGCLLALRTFILNYHEEITETWKYRMPIFCYKGKMFCYLWIHKKNQQPYVGIVEGRYIEHPLLIQEKRSRMKIMFIDPSEDLPLETIDEIFKMAMKYYK